MKLLRKILINPIYHVISGLFVAGAVYFSHYMRCTAKCSFKAIYYPNYIFLILSFLIFLITYKDECNETKVLVKESLSGYFFFIAFLLITIFLRGEA